MRVAHTRIPRAKTPDPATEWRASRARDLNQLALLFGQRNGFSEAEPLFRRALAIREKSYGPDHPDTAESLGNLGELLRATNRLSEAESLLRRALKIDEANLGPDHPKTETARKRLAALEATLGSQSQLRQS